MAIVTTTLSARTLQQLAFDQLKAFRHRCGHLALHRLDRRGVVRPTRAAPAMRVRDVHGRAQIAVELLQLRQGERIRDRREFCLRKTLRHEEQQCGSFGECTAFGHQSRNSPFRVYREVFGASLRLRTEIDRHRLMRCAVLFERDVRRECTGARSVVPERSRA
jgi:hypothetical protein